MPPETGESKSRPVVALAGFGSEMVGFTLLGVFADWLAGSLPIFTVILTLAGMTLAFWHLSKWAKSRGRP